MFFLGNSQKQTKVDVSTEYAESPKCFSWKKTAFFGMISLLMVALVYAPELLDSTYAYGVDNNDYYSGLRPS